MRKTVARLGAPVLVGLGAVVLVPSLLRPGELLVFRDLLDFFYPLKVHLARSLAEGAVPFWNPWTLGGEPFLANPFAQVLYPPNWLFALVPATAWALSLFTALHLAWAGWGALAFARRLGAGVAASLLAAAGFMAGGYLPSLVDMSNQLCTQAWLPWTCLGAVSFSAGGSRRALAAWAAAAAMSLLAGAPQVAVVGGAFSVVLAAAGGWHEPDPRGRVRRAVAGGLVVAALVAACCAPLLGPFAAVVGRSDRVGAEAYAGGAGALEPARLDALVRPPTGPFSGPAGRYVRSVYLGAVPALLALVGALRRDRTSRALVAATLVSGLLAASPSVPLLGPALAAAAPWLRYPFKYFAAAALALPLLSAGGLELAVARGTCRRRRLAPMLALVLAVAVLGDLVVRHRALLLRLPAAAVLAPTPAITWLAAHTSPDGPRLHTLPLTRERLDRRAERLARGDLFGSVRERVELLEGGLPAVFGIAATTGGSSLPDRAQARRLEHADGPLARPLQEELRAGFLLVEADRALPLEPVPVDGGAARLYRLPPLEPRPERTWDGPNRCLGPPGLPPPSDLPGWREAPPGTWTYRPPGLVAWSLVGLFGWLAVAGLALTGRPEPGADPG